MTLAKLLLFSLLFGSSGSLQNLEFSKANQAPARRNHATTLVAFLDGVINLVSCDSGKVIWSFASGSPTYTSYQAPINHEDENASASRPGYFIDCGHDGKLVAHTNRGKVGLNISMKEFIRFLPLVSYEGRVIIGSEKTTVFIVDAYIGELIGVHDSSTDATNTSPNIIEKATTMKQEKKQPDKQFSFTRTDYTLTSFAANSDKVLWNVTVADIDVALVCQENPKSNHHYKSYFRFEMPLSCGSKTVVHGVNDISEPIVLLTLLPELEVIYSIMKETRNEEISSQLDIGETHSETTLLYSSTMAQDQRDVGKPNYIVSVFTKTRIEILVILIVIVFLMYHKALMAKMLKSNVKSSRSRRKRNRKSRKNVNDVGKA